MKNYWKYTLTAAVVCSFAAAACGESGHHGFAVVFGAWALACIAVSAIVLDNVAP